MATDGAVRFAHATETMAELAYTAGLQHVFFNAAVNSLDGSGEELTLPLVVSCDESMTPGDLRFNLYSADASSGNGHGPAIKLNSQEAWVDIGAEHAITLRGRDGRFLAEMEPYQWHVLSFIGRYGLQKAQQKAAHEGQPFAESPDA